MRLIPTSRKPRPQLYRRAVGVSAGALAALACASSAQAATCYTTVSTAKHARQDSWRAVGSSPLSDAEAAKLVKPAPEVRKANVGPNHTCPTVAQLSAVHAAKTDDGKTEAQSNPYRHFVTGGFTGTTDEILQWAAHKWGIPEDILRAQATHESWWRMSTLGDQHTDANPGAFPSQARISGKEVWGSMGLMQIKWRSDGSQNAGSEPLRWMSTAFNVDYYASVVRFYYDDPQGLRSAWKDGYKRGDGWGSIGSWYAPSPWGNSGQQSDIADVKQHLADRTWTDPDFLGAG